jgi:hypothetical protein
MVAVAGSSMLACGINPSYGRAIDSAQQKTFIWNKFGKDATEDCNNLYFS